MLNTRSQKTAFGIFVLLAMALFLRGQEKATWRQPYTGDEPSYLFTAWSFFSDGDFDVRDNFARGEHTKLSLGANSLKYFHADKDWPGHPVTVSMFASPLVGYFGIRGGRYLSVIFALLTSILLFVALRRRFAASVIEATFIVTVNLFSIPFYSMAAALYTESFASFWILLAFFLLTGINSRRELTIAVCSIWALPFIHMRFLVITLAMFCVLSFQIWTSSRRDKLMLRDCAIAFIIGAVAFLIFQLRMYHGFSTNTNAPPIDLSPFNVLGRFSSHLFDLQKGLLPYSPVWIFSFVGFGLAAIKGDRLLKYALFILAAYLCVLTWGDPGEATPGRFWAGVTPLMSCAFLPILRLGQRWFHALFGFAILASFGNTYTFSYSPGLYFNNFGYSFLYSDMIPRRFAVLDLAMHLPWGFDHEAFGQVLYWLLGMVAFLIFSLMALVCVSRKLHMAGVVGALVAVGFALLQCFFVPLPVDRYIVHSNSETRTVVIDFPQKQRVNVLRLNGADCCHAHIFEYSIAGANGDLMRIRPTIDHGSVVVLQNDTAAEKIVIGLRTPGSERPEQVSIGRDVWSFF